MRQVINKLITEEDLYAAVDAAFSQGWRRVKLYFLTGLPTEMDDDTLGIAELAKNVVEIGKQHTKGASATVSVGGFVPEAAHAVPVVRPERGRRAAAQGRPAPRRPAQEAARGLKWHDPQATFAEGIASRGDRRIGAVIERVWRAGGTFQEWSEHFDLDRWLDAMAAEGLDPDWYVTRHRHSDEVLPWDHIAAGLHRDFLWGDWQAALAEHGLPDCRWTPCYDCGVCTGYALEHVVASAVAARGREPGNGPGSRAGATPFRCSCSASGVRHADSRQRGARCAVTPGSRCGSASPSEARCGSSRTATSPVPSSGRFASPSSRWRSRRASRPRPKVSFGPALAVGYESDAEYLDRGAGTHGRRTPTKSPRGLERSPEGMASHRRRRTRRPGSGAPRSHHVARVPGHSSRAPIARDSGAVAEFNARPEIRVTVTRKGQDSIDDIRPSVLALSASPDAPVIEIEVVTKPRTLRVADVVTGLRTMTYRRGDAGRGPRRSHPPMD